MKILRRKSSEPNKLRITKLPKTLRELALEKMRIAIHDFHFRPGERLVERDVCEQLGVSRSVVREVMRQLEAEGLVQNIPHQGPSVATLDRETAAQIYELRGLLESSAARAAAYQANEGDIAQMAKSLERIEAAYAKADFQSVLTATTDFYRTMFLCGHKRIAWDVVQKLNGRISWLRSMTIASPNRNQSGPAQLYKIFEAIRSRNEEEAAVACRDHVATAAKIAEAALAANASSYGEVEKK